MMNLARLFDEEFYAINRSQNNSKKVICLKPGINTEEQSFNHSLTSYFNHCVNTISSDNPDMELLRVKELAFNDVVMFYNEKQYFELLTSKKIENSKQSFQQFINNTENINSAAKHIHKILNNNN